MINDQKSLSQQHNDLFFLCGLIEYIARKTKNERGTIVNALGVEMLRKIYNLADVYHCENIDKVTADLITQCGILTGTYDNLQNLEDFSIPTHWDIGRVYERLIYTIAQERSTNDYIAVLIEVYTSWLPKKIDDYRSSIYYENNSYLTASYHLGHAV